VLAREFARAGAKVAICARDERELERAREEFAHKGWALVTTKCDVGVRAEAEQAVETVLSLLLAVGSTNSSARTTGTNVLADRDCRTALPGANHRWYSP
jgi:NAD(P)-dependent dehydrogenase (short-subunit alcohol dehydrogenase family)